MEKRYYYKTQDEKGWLCLKSPSKDASLIELTEAQWNAHLASIQPAEPTAAELARQAKLNHISELKRYLASTDYEAIKFAEGEMSAEDYEPYKLQRRAARAEINEIEAELAE